MFYTRSMTSNIEITNEQINDIPLLVGIMSEMGIQTMLDRSLKEHGSWQGISVGTLVVIWLSYMLTEQDHRMVMVRQWVAARQHMFEKLLGIELRETDCSDDRLAQVLNLLGYEETQRQLDETLSQHWIQAYALPTQTVRFDTTSVSVYHTVDNPESLLQFGHSKDHRPDLRQFKIMLSTLDPLGMPLSCQIVSGQRADDGLYIPAYDAMMGSLSRRDVLVVGDSKMAGLATGAHIVANGSCYLSAYNPSRKQAEVQQWVEQALHHQDQWQFLDKIESGEQQTLAVIYESQRRQHHERRDQAIDWSERVFVTRSNVMQAGLVRQRRRVIDLTCDRLAQFQQPPKRGRKYYRSDSDLQQKVDEILSKHQLQNLIQVELTTDLLPDGTSRWIIDSIAIDWQAWQAMVERLGWRVYLSNTTPQQYEATGVYRHQFLPERTFSRLKTRHLNIRPLYLRDQQHIAGLTWLLSLALRILTLTEFRVRTALVNSAQQLIGLNPASLSQPTQRPTTERILQAFQNITFTCIRNQNEAQYYVTSLIPTQIQILGLLQLPSDLYTRLTHHSTEPIFNLRE